MHTGIFHTKITKQHRGRVAVIMPEVRGADDEIVKTGRNEWVLVYRVGALFHSADSKWSRYEVASLRSGIQNAPISIDS
jgi:hypothetical protein